VTGETVSHYRVLEKLGGGGMGVVYKAEDSKLHRFVALKFLPEQLARDHQALERFQREAQAASVLDHTNICTIYEIGEHEGQPFIAMELVEGQTLAEMLKSGPIALPEAIRIARQVAEGLEEAHEHDLIHRDLKPANVIVTSKGRAKIVDFGLAKLLRPLTPGESTAEDPLLTRTGAVLGTVPYMAPEQLRGEPADARTDLYAFGELLYEMVTGRRPFTSTQTPQLIAAILTQAPTPPRQLNKEVPPELESIILKSLAKRPSERYRSAHELLTDLGPASTATGLPLTTRSLAAVRRARLRKAAAWAIGAGLILAVAGALVFLGIPGLRHRRRAPPPVSQTGLPPQKELAVLPFSVLGGKARDLAFSRGLSETLAAKLTQLSTGHSLQVVPASDVYAHHVATASDAHTEFGVNLVISGSLERAGDRVRITYALVDPSTERQLDASTITQAASDPFGLEDKVVEGAAKMLGLSLEPAERQVVESHGTARAEAFESYLQAVGYLQNYERVENIDKAIGYFQSALKTDPAYALAYAGLGDAYWRRYEATQDTSWVDRARESCDRAVTLDSNLPASHLCLGTLENGTGQYARAESEFRKVIENEPTNTRAYGGLATAEYHLGKTADAQQTYLRAISLEPNYWGPYIWLGNLYWNTGQYPKAAGMFKKVIELAPQNYFGYDNLGVIYYFQGRWADAEEMFKKSITIHRSPTGYSNLGTVIFFQGHYAESARMFEKATEMTPKDEALWGNLADAYRWAPGEHDKAAAAYAKAINLVDGELRVNPRSAESWAHLALYRAKTGERQAALQAVQKADQFGPHDIVVNYYTAIVYHLAGDQSQALLWLKRAIAKGYSLYEIRADPEWTNLRNAPEFKKLVGNEKN
jgi:serine/threonine protein kinase/tetratricopeptide (TPR) repeat protein